MRGRRPVGDAAALVVIRVRVTARQFADLRRLARANQTTVSGLCRDALDEVAAECGMAGVFRSGPQFCPTEFEHSPIIVSSNEADG